MFHRETVEKNRSYFIANMGVAAILTFTLVQVDDGKLLGRKSTRYFVNESVFYGSTAAVKLHLTAQRRTMYGRTEQAYFGTLIHKFNLEVESS